VHKFSPGFHSLSVFLATENPAKAGFRWLLTLRQLSAAMTVVVPVPTMPVGMGWSHRSCQSGKYDQRKQNLLHLYCLLEYESNSYIPKRAQPFLVVAS